MDENEARALWHGVEECFEEFPLLDRLTFGMDVSPEPVPTTGGVVHTLMFPVSILATYHGGATRIVGEIVEVLGLCDCPTCVRRKDTPRYVARVIGTDLVVHHSRGTSYHIAGQPRPENRL